MNPRDAYLAWQAEIGTEEVVLVQPWIKPRPTTSAASGPATSYEAPFKSGTSTHFPAASTPIPAGADFFQSIAESLAKPEPFVKKGSSGSTPAPGPKSTTPPAASLPEHRDLNAYWSFLEASYPIWFPGTSPALVRAEGSSRARLAVVELSPEGNRVFSGTAGEFLDRMLKGIDLTRDQLYLTSVMKTAPAGKTWARKDIARMVPALLQELRLAECGLVLLLGEACAQGVLRTGQSLAALAETAVNQGNMTLVATEHPSRLMAADDTARRAAWNQLKWLRARLPAHGS
jgi:uracil-DNA glycosylase family 4